MLSLVPMWEIAALAAQEGEVFLTDRSDAKRLTAHKDCSQSAKPRRAHNTCRQTMYRSAPFVSSRRDKAPVSMRYFPLLAVWFLLVLVLLKLLSDSLHAFDDTAVIRIAQLFCNLHMSEPIQPKLKNCLIPF